MTVTVNVREAKTHLSRLLDKVSAGEQVIIERRGEPVALLSATPAKNIPRFGLMPGKVNDEAAMAPLSDLAGSRLD
ncbi:MAG: type II toxin-antitoxin system prevent-host-death family antitoxin [Propionibacteriaceae bacterium]|nr:type II toxin-antitoxin system prevent-host-death family antitoxin [Propionibacteriaceae bacterium]